MKTPVVSLNSKIICSCIILLAPLLFNPPSKAYAEVPTRFNDSYFTEQVVVRGTPVLLEARLEADTLGHPAIQDADLYFQIYRNNIWQTIPDDGISTTDLKTNSDGIGSVYYLIPENLPIAAYPIRVIYDGNKPPYGQTSRTVNLTLEISTIQSQLNGNTVPWQLLDLNGQVISNISNNGNSSRIPLMLVHGAGNEPEENARWTNLLNYIISHQQQFTNVDVYVWRHDSSKAVGFNGYTGNAAELEDCIYNYILPHYQPGTKIIFVAHSRGGLVVRSFMNQNNHGNGVLGLITLATPHHGSPFGVPDWAAIRWANMIGTYPAAKDAFNALVGPKNSSKIFQIDEIGDLNLAWDNLDSAVAGNYPGQFNVNFSNNGLVNLTLKDTNKIISATDETVLYSDNYKNIFGTLTDLNQCFNNSSYSKIVAFAAFDENLEDNGDIGNDDFISWWLNERILHNDFDEHEGLKLTTIFLAIMSEDIVPIGNNSVYYANDGMVPLQSALFLDLSKGDAFSSATDWSVTPDINKINLRQKIKRYYILNGQKDNIKDHLDLLDTNNQSYWWTVSSEIEDFAMTPVLISPADEEVIPTLIPTFDWSAFSSVASQAQSGYQLRVLCDTDGDSVVYDTGFINDPSGHQHIYSPGSYSDPSPAFLDNFSYDFNQINSPNDLWQKQSYNWTLWDCTYKEEHVSTQNGVLLLTVPAGPLKEGGQIVSVNTYQYGRYEAKIKMSSVPGVVNGFFYYLSDNSEIDIEFLSNEHNSHTIHFSTKPAVEGNHLAVNLPFDPSEDFHIYGFNWYSDRVDFLVDGIIMGTISINVPSQPGKIMLNNWTGNPDWGGGPPSETATMQVGWVRYIPPDGSGKISEPLQWDKHYHWHVRYQDNTGKWSSWSKDTPTDHQDFYTYTLSSSYIPVGNAPSWITFSHSGNHAYVSNWNSENISVINTNTRTVEATTPASDNHGHIAVANDDNYLYMTNYGDGSVKKVRLSDYISVAAIPTGLWAHGCWLSPDGQWLYAKSNCAGTGLQGKVLKINTSTNSVSQILQFPSEPGDIAITSDGSLLYVPLYATNTIQVVATSSLSIIGSINLPNRAYGPIALSHDNQTLYMGSGIANALYAVNTNSKLVVDTITGITPTGIDISADDQFLYVGNGASNEVLKINTSTLDIAEHIPINRYAGYLAIAPGGNAIYVTNQTNNSVTIINLGQMTNYRPNKPWNIAPGNGTTGVSLTPNFQATSYNDPNGDTHKFTQWEIRQSTGTYAAPVYSGIQSSSSGNLTSFTLPPGVLDYSKTYYWHVRYADEHDSWSEYSNETIFITLSPPNDPPIKPNVPAGTSSGYIGTSYNYTTSTIDPNGDNVAYCFDWGDGIISDWTGFVASGNPAGLAHSYPNPGAYQIKAKAKDEPGLIQQTWSDPLTVTISAPDYAFTPSPSPNSRTIIQGGTTNYTVYLESLLPCTYPISLTAELYLFTNPQTGTITPSLTQNAVAPPGTTTLNISTSGDVTPGRYWIVVKGDRGGIKHITSVELIITSPAHGRIFGNVKDADTQSPLNGIEVSVFTPGSNQKVNSGITNSQGNYSMENLTPGQYILRIDNASSLATYEVYAGEYTSQGTWNWIEHLGSGNGIQEFDLSSIGRTTAPYVKIISNGSTQIDAICNLQTGQYIGDSGGFNLSDAGLSYWTNMLYAPNGLCGILFSSGYSIIGMGISDGPGNDLKIFAMPSALDGNYYSQTTMENVTVNNTTPTEVNFSLQQAAKIYGKVTDGSGSPIAQVRIDCWRESDRWGAPAVITDSSGSFEFNYLLPGNIYTLEFNPPDSTEYVAKRFNLNITSPGNHEENVTLDSGAIQVSGMITEAASGNPLDNILIVYTQGSDFWAGARSNSSGDYLLANLPKGEGTVRVEPENTFAQKAIKQDFQNNTTLNFALLPESTLSGVVVDDVTATPLANIRVVYSNNGEGAWKETFTDSSGQFNFGSLVEGISEFTVRPEAATQYNGKYYAWKNEYLYLSAGQHIANHTLRLKQGSLISGYAKDAVPEQNPIVNEDIGADGENGENCWLQTDANGYYQMRLSPAKYGITLDDLNEPGAQRVTLPQEITVASPTDNHGVNFTVYDATTGSHISGQVVASAPKHTGSSFEVFAFKAGQEFNINNINTLFTVTQADLVGAGPYSLLVPPNRAYDLGFGIWHQDDNHIMSLTLRGKVPSVNVGAAGNTTNVADFNYTTEGGTVTGAVTYNGQPVLMASVVLTDPSSNFIGFAESDQNGIYHFYNVTAGNYLVQARHPDYGISQQFGANGVTDSGTVTADVLIVGDLIIDNTDPNTSKIGTWAASTSASGYYGSNYQYRFAGTGANKLTWLPAITTSGTYEVFARWTASSNRATNAKYAITNHTGSSAPVEVSQQINNGTWVSLGKHSFLSGGTCQISLNDNANGVVIADAVKLVYVSEKTDIIVDNTDPNTNKIGTWTASTGTPGYYGSNYQYRFAGTGTNKFTWLPAITTSGTYEVFARWTSFSNRATNAKYTITNHTGSSTPVEVSQQINNGIWISLGKHSFQAGGTAQITLSDSANNIVIADAIKLVYISPYTDIVVDNTDPNTNKVGTWTTSTSTPGYYGSNYQYLPPGTGTKKFIWLPDITTSGTYEVYARWVSYSNRATNAKYSVTNHTGTSAPVEVNQQINSGIWVSLGKHSFQAGGTAQITLTDNANGIVIADAVKLVYISPSLDMVVDNTDPNTNKVGTWTASTSTPGYYGSNYQYRPAGTGTNKFTWLPAITTSGTYEVFARWTSASNRATNAKYTITNHTGSSAPVEVSQQINNGIWISLGKHSFQAGGTAQISLSDNANNIVIADAVKLVYQN